MSESNENYAQNKIPTGFEGQNVPDDFSIPSCGIEDIDRALFNLFNDKIKFTVHQNGEIVKVPVIFATGERFALLNRQAPIRDKNGTIILPLISIRRKSIDQSENNGGIGRGIGQDTGDLVIKRKLGHADRDYQRIVNRLGLKHQDDVASSLNQVNSTSPESALPETVSTRRAVGYNKDDKESGSVLKNVLDDNIYEIITIPYPPFFVMHYEITLWTQYTQHMNQLIETMMHAYDGQGNQFKIETDKGYWFVAFIESEINAEDNFSDFTDEERIVKATFSIMTTAYLVGQTHAGQRNHIRKFVSAPQVSFEVLGASTQISDRREYGGIGTGDYDKFVLSDVVELNKFGNPAIDRNQSNVDALVVELNPFTGEEEKTYSKVLTRNQRQGETVLSSKMIIKLDEIT